MEKYDVIVAGGGSAGVAAAVTAARRGARTLLVERSAVLGGQAPLALVHSICGLYRLADEGPPVFANAGFAQEFAERMLQNGGAHGPVRMGRVWVLLTQPAAFARTAAQIAIETPGLEVRLQTELTAADDAGLHLGAPPSRAASPLRVRATSMIDATGDAVLAALLGAACEQEPSARLQRPAYIFGLGGVAPEVADEDARFRLARRIVSAVQEGLLPPAALGTALRANGPLGGIFVTIDLCGGSAYAPTDPTCIATLERESRSLAEDLVAFLRAHVEGFEQCAISEYPTRIGIRESRRIVGEYRLETADLEHGATFPDTVALATWPMELRETNRGPRLRYPTDDRPCAIPLRALRFRDHPHCFMAGRCISSSHEAQASLRVIGTCLATGEAAGFAAAAAANVAQASCLPRAEDAGWKPAPLQDP